MSKRRWVRGKALQTVIALREIRAGDEVLINRRARLDDLDAQTVRARRLLVVSVDDDVTWPINVAHEFDNSNRDEIVRENDWCDCIAPSQIGAWRRPA